MRRTMARHVRHMLMLLSLLTLLPATSAAGPASGGWQGDPQAGAEVQAAYTKFGAARTYRQRMTLAGQGGTFTQNMEIVVPDRVRMSGMPGSPPNFEIIVIGGETWARGPGVPGGCAKLPAGGARRPNPREGVDHATGATITVARGGPQTVEGTATQLYNLTIEAQGRQTQQKVYVATGTGQLRRIETTSDQGAVTIDYFDFDAPITINAPC